jgi:hypothetical protein
LHAYIGGETGGETGTQLIFRPSGTETEASLAVNTSCVPVSAPFSLADYHPSSPNIAATVLSQSEMEWWPLSRFPAACGAVIPILPGYSRNGKTAIFGFTFATGNGGGYYLLKMVNGRWEISGKRFWFLSDE